MGNACEICQEEKGNYVYDPYQRQFSNYNTLPNGQPLGHQGSPSIGGDAPNPALVKAGIILPTLSPQVLQTIERQNTIRTFTKDNIQGMKLQPF